MKNTIFNSEKSKIKHINKSDNELDLEINLNSNDNNNSDNSSDSNLNMDNKFDSNSNSESGSESGSESEWCTESSTSSEHEEETQNFMGDLLNNKYIVLHKIGGGAFSSVWLSYNSIDSKYYILKIQFEDDYDDGLMEGKMLTRMKNNYIIKIYERFIINKNRVCLVLEVLGECLCSLLDYNSNTGLSIPIVKKITKQLLDGVKYLHESRKLIHTDLKVENILLTSISPKIQQMKTDFEKTDLIKRFLELNKIQFSNLPSNRKKRNKIIKNKKDNLFKHYKDFVCETLSNFNYSNDLVEKININSDNCDIKIADFGTCVELDDMFTDELQTEYYRSPEIILGYKYNEKIDIWSVGCIIVELLTGNLLFDPKKSKKYNRTTNHLLDIVELFGQFDKSMISKCKYKNKFFNKKNEIINCPEIEFSSLKQFFIINELSEKDAKELSQFLLPFFKFKPKERISANDALKLSWLTT